MKIFRIIFLALAFFIAAVLPSQAEQDEVAKIQKAYETIKDLTGSFVQKSFVKDLKRTDVYNGRFFIKPPKMRWEYSGDKPQVIYVTGSEIIVFQKKENQVIRSKFDRATYGQAPITLLAGLGHIREEFDIISSKPDLIVLKPRKPMGNVEHLEIVPSGAAFPIKTLIIVDNLSNKIEIQLNNVKINTGIKNSVFSFSPPKNAAVLDR
ncbi:MAG TPA: outer membrane lipoprotein carrier protein LolA [Dissulfurispiraceae bacterium]|nr:outer membrane lipoprotein carrier protein LolA [Dissulfurispiraceae bacterium]